jgi:hypothetical protein
MSIAYVIITTNLDYAEHFTNRFLRSVCKETTSQLPYISSVSVPAEHLADKIGITLEEVLQSELMLKKLAGPIRAGIQRAIDSKRPIIHLHKNLKLRERSQFLETLPIEYERIAVLLYEDESELEQIRYPSSNEGFDKIWVVQRSALNSVAFAYEFIEGSFDD